MACIPLPSEGVLAMPNRCSAPRIRGRAQSSLRSQYRPCPCRAPGAPARHEREAQPRSRQSGIPELLPLPLVLPLLLPLLPELVPLPLEEPAAIPARTPARSPTSSSARTPRSCFRCCCAAAAAAPSATPVAAPRVASRSPVAPARDDGQTDEQRPPTTPGQPGLLPRPSCLVMASRQERKRATRDRCAAIDANGHCLTPSGGACIAVDPTVRLSPKWMTRPSSAPACVRPGRALRRENPGGETGRRAWRLRRLSSTDYDQKVACACRSVGLWTAKGRSCDRDRAQGAWPRALRLTPDFAGTTQPVGRAMSDNDSRRVSGKAVRSTPPEQRPTSGTGRGISSDTLLTSPR